MKLSAYSFKALRTQGAKTLLLKLWDIIWLIEAVEQGHTVIKKHDLFAIMIANAWYTIN